MLEVSWVRIGGSVWLVSWVCVGGIGSVASELV